MGALKYLDSYLGSSSKDALVEEWFQAVESRNYEFIECHKQRLKGVQDAFLNTALIAATRNNDLRMIGILAADEATIVNANRQTACMIAIENDSLKAFYILQPFEMPEESQKADAKTAVRDVTEGFNYFIPILSQDVYIKFATAHLKVLFHALTTGLLCTVKYIVEHKVNWRDSYTKACIMVSLAYGHYQIAAYLLRYCVDIGALSGCDLYRSIQLDDDLGYPLADTAFADTLLQPAIEKTGTILSLVESLRKKHAIFAPSTSTSDFKDSRDQEEIKIAALDKELEFEEAKNRLSQLESLTRVLHDEVARMATDNETMKLAIEATVSDQDAQVSIMQLTAEVSDLRKELERKENLIKEMKERIAASSVYDTVFLTTSDLPHRPLGGGSSMDSSQILPAQNLSKKHASNARTSRGAAGAGANADVVVELGHELNLAKLELDKRQDEIDEFMVIIQTLRKELRTYRPQVGKLSCFDKTEKI